jgi:GntR family transcriptional regulator, transcriptional repressor for pyruvate dehydrogenase complex
MFLAEKKVRLLDEAADRIKSYIEDHQLQPGMRLPSERDLVKQLSLGRTSIREGLRYLEMLGLIEIKAGKGIYLKDHKESSLNKTINSWFTVHEGTVRELIELREAIETHSAFLAAMRASAMDIIEMEQAVSIMRVAAEQNDVARFVQADTNFHDAIARASGNSLLRRVLGSIAQEIITFRMAAAYFGAEMLQRSLTDHAQILKAIVAREPSQALQAMREHIVRTPMDFNLLVGLNER